MHIEGHFGAFLQYRGEGGCSLVAWGCWWLWLIADGDMGRQKVFQDGQVEVSISVSQTVWQGA